jgi:sortase (surface protein transpeptidase)
MRTPFLGLKNILFVFSVFFIIAFLILSGRSFFSLTNYQIKDLYHYFIFELSRSVDLSLINPNSPTAWELYKTNSQKEIVTTYLNPVKKENTTTTTKPFTSVIATPVTPTTTIRSTVKVIPIEDDAWKELIAKYPNKDFVFIPQFGVQAPLLSPPNKNLSLIYKDLRKGVVLFPGTAAPGSGYSVILGHSSAYPWDPGDYRSVFSLLNKLNYGDPFFVYYQGNIYSFKVVAKKIFIPLKKDNGLTTAQALPPRDKPTVVLQSCWPVGASVKRMAVQGELITED